MKNKEGLVITIYYDSGINKIIIQEAEGFSKSQSLHILKENNQEWNIGEITIYERNYDDVCSIYSFDYMDIAFAIIVEKTVSKEKVEAIVYGLTS